MDRYTQRALLLNIQWYQKCSGDTMLLEYMTPRVEMPGANLIIEYRGDAAELQLLQTFGFKLLRAIPKRIALNTGRNGKSHTTK